MKWSAVNEKAVQAALKASKRAMDAHLAAMDELDSKMGNWRFNCSAAPVKSVLGVACDKYDAADWARLLAESKLEAAIKKADDEKIPDPENPPLCKDIR
jgi:hypothetical protein